jgi:hypothetical protein
MQTSDGAELACITFSDARSVADHTHFTPSVDPDLRI